MYNYQPNLQNLRQYITEIALKHHRNPHDIKWVAVSKTFPSEAIAGVADLGVGDFAENYVDE
ncbi:MAG: YggS family pyridoxal phosphate enzyme, partial [Gammaproteobacteria bacterium]|nr:YggS family pyridoxal phosphate enzyme [Gammaproteobacteria bacterium]